MIQNHHAVEARGRISTVFVMAHADDKVQRAATRRHECARPSPLSLRMIVQFLWLRRGLEPADMQRQASQAREVAPPNRVERG